MYQENGALVQFYREAVQNNFKSKEAGRPVYEDRDFIKIQTPGDTNTVIQRPATEQDKHRFPKCWQAYQNGLELAQEGTPLEEWNQITRSQTLELKHKGIATVETLATVSDAAIQKFGPGYQQLRDAAKRFIDTSSVQADAEKVARERDELKEQLALMQQQMQALQAQVSAQAAAAAQTNDDPEPPVKRGPGRPAKQSEA